MTHDRQGGGVFGYDHIRAPLSLDRLLPLLTEEAVEKGVGEVSCNLVCRGRVELEHELGCILLRSSYTTRLSRHRILHVYHGIVCHTSSYQLPQTSHLMSPTSHLIVHVYKSLYSTRAAISQGDRFTNIVLRARQVLVHVLYHTRSQASPPLHSLGAEMTAAGGPAAALAACTDCTSARLHIPFTLSAMIG